MDNKLSGRNAVFREQETRVVHSARGLQWRGSKFLPVSNSICETTTVHKKKVIFEVTVLKHGGR